MAQHESLNLGVIVMWEGGKTDSFYYADDFNNHDFGILTSENSFFLKSGRTLISKDTSGEIIDADMFYRIYKNGEPPGKFINVNLPLHSEWVESGFTNQLWWNDAPDETYLNILTGLTDGTYSIEIYFSAETGENILLYLNNATFNYIAQFSYSGSAQTAKSRGLTNSDIFDICPNPADEKLCIKFNSVTNVESIKMIDAQSSVIYEGGRSRGIPGTPVDIPIDNVDAGTYFVRVQTENGVSVQRIIITK